MRGELAQNKASLWTHVMRACTGAFFASPAAARRRRRQPLGHLRPPSRSTASWNMLCWKIIRGSTRPVLVSCVPCGPSVGLNGGISRRSRVCRMDTWPAVSATMRPRAENTIYLHSEWRSSGGGSTITKKKSLHRTIDLIELIGTMCLACFFLRSGEK
jgi:hypothetical protein